MSPSPRPPIARLDRRFVLGAGLALTQVGSALAADAPKVDVYDAYAKVLASRAGGAACWWFSGLMFAHVDGLREFAVLAEHSLLVCVAEARQGSMTYTWRQIGYYEDLFTGQVARTWDNPFLGRAVSLPPIFSEGPKHYTLNPRPPLGATLTLDYDKVRVIALGLTGNVVEGRVVLAQTETKIQGFPGPDGRLPAVNSPGVTGVQTVMSFVAAQSAVEDPARASVSATGFYNSVYDSLPAWMGFGDRYGSALSKGLMLKAALDARPDPAVWSRLKQLHPRTFKGDRLRTDWI